MLGRNYEYQQIGSIFKLVSCTSMYNALQVFCIAIYLKLHDLTVFQLHVYKVIHLPYTFCVLQTAEQLQALKNKHASEIEKQKDFHRDQIKQSQENIQKHLVRFHLKLYVTILVTSQCKVL